MISAGDVVLVTGASSGLGLAVARAVSARSAHVVLVARDDTALTTAAYRCAGDGALTTQVMPADVGDHEQVQRVVDAAVERYGRIDAVVNAAAVIACGPVESLPADVHDAVIRTNLNGSVHVARAALPVLRRQGWGSLVLVGSLLGHITAPYVAPYVVSKWGVRALARQLRTEVRDVPGMRIGYVAPGAMDTPIYEQAADYLGWRVRPPLPACSPDRVARQVLDVLDGRRRRVDAGLVHTGINGTARTAFRLLPGPAYDALVRGLLALTGIDHSTAVEPHAGNVLDSGPSGHAARGGAGGIVRAAARNIVVLGHRRRSRPQPGRRASA